MRLGRVRVMTGKSLVAIPDPDADTSNIGDELIIHPKTGLFHKITKWKKKYRSATRFFVRGANPASVTISLETV